MRADKDTWLVMHLDVSDTVTVADTPSVHLALVLDPKHGRALGAMSGQTRDDALRGALVAGRRPPACHSSPRTSEPSPAAGSDRSASQSSTASRQAGRPGRSSHARGGRPVGGIRPHRGRSRALLVLICERAMFALTGKADARSAAFTNLKRWLKASDGRRGGRRRRRP